jgi:co-chaperonin GroES (HSP10)
MSNESGIDPKGYRIVVFPDAIETKTKSGIITTTVANELREEMAQIEGTVVAMGKSCFKEEPEPWCVVGDRIIFGKYSGLLVEGNDKKKYRIINDENVVATRQEKNNE